MLRGTSRHKSQNIEFYMRILNVNATHGRQSGGGNAERTLQMSRFLARQDGVLCTVLTLDLEIDAERIQAHVPAKVIVIPCLYKRFYIPRGGWKTIQKAVAESDLIHLMGHWTLLNIIAYIAARRSEKPYVVCPAGALSIFGRSVIIKWIYNIIVGKRIIRKASICIAVTDAEISNFEKYGVQSSQVKVIPNGVTIEDFPPTPKLPFLKRFNIPDAPYILFVGRLNPIKGPDLLLEAFTQARIKFPQFHLVFAGPDGGLLSELTQSVRQSGISEYVHFLGHIDGPNKSAAYQHAALLVVPSRQEAMSIVALEAGICGTPVMLTDQCGFSEIRTVDESLEVPATSEAIANGLIRLLTEPGLLKRVAPAFQNFVSRKFTWDSIVVQYIKIYDTILRPGTNPSSKRI